NDCNFSTPDGSVWDPVSGIPQISMTGLGGGTLSWTPLSGASGYDIVRGSLVVLASSHGNFTLATDTCLGDYHFGTSLVDAAVPAAGAGYWYLVRGENCSFH